MEVLREEADKVGRSHVPTAVQVRVGMSRVDAETSAAYAQAGVTDLVMHVESSDVAKHRQELERFANSMGLG